MPNLVFLGMTNKYYVHTLLYSGLHCCDCSHGHLPDKSDGPMQVSLWWVTASQTEATPSWASGIQEPELNESNGEKFILPTWLLTEKIVSCNIQNVTWLTSITMPHGLSGIHSNHSLGMWSPPVPYQSSLNFWEPADFQPMKIWPCSSLTIPVSCLTIANIKAHEIPNPWAAS